MKSRFHSDNGLKTDANGPLEQNFTIKKECQTCHEHAHVREPDMSSKLAVPSARKQAEMAKTLRVAGNILTIHVLYGVTIRAIDDQISPEGFQR